MQSVDLTEFTNSSGWYVEHDADSQLYIVKSSRGNVLSTKFTRRREAELFLHTYLKKVEAIPSKGRPKKKKCQPESSNKKSPASQAA